MRKLRRILVVVLFVVGVIAPVAQSAEAKQKVLRLSSPAASMVIIR